MGIRSRAQAIKRSEAPSVQTDNYAEFIQRIAVAHDALQVKLNQINRRHKFIETQQSHEYAALEVWKSRADRLAAVIQNYSGDPAGYQRVADLSDAAQRLYTAAQNRYRDISLVVDSLSKQADEAYASLTSLAKAKRQLETERRLGQARESLLQAASEPHHSVIPGAVQDSQYREIRTLVAQAEALVELKRW